MGFPIIVASFERHKGVHQLRGRLGSFTQVGSLVISEAWKSKKSGIICKIRGRPNTKYGPALRVSSISNSE